jgi:hypothetical protein
VTGRLFTILPAKPTSTVYRETSYLRSRTRIAISRTHPSDPPISLPFYKQSWIGGCIFSFDNFPAVTKERVRWMSRRSSGGSFAARLGEFHNIEFVA